MNASDNMSIDSLLSCFNYWISIGIFYSKTDDENDDKDNINYNNENLKTSLCMIFMYL